MWFLKGKTIPVPKELIKSLEILLVELKTKFIMRSLDDVETIKITIERLEIHVVEIKLCLC